MIQTIYVAGPYTGDGTPEGRVLNVKTAIMMAEQLTHLGLYPFVPHFFHYWDQVYAHEYSFWMDQDALWITKCDALFMFDESPGAKKDAKIAEQFDIPVFLTLQDVAKAVLAERQG